MVVNAGADGNMPIDPCALSTLDFNVRLYSDDGNPMLAAVADSTSSRRRSLRRTGDPAKVLSASAGFSFRKVSADGNMVLGPCPISTFSFNVRVYSDVGNPVLADLVGSKLGLCPESLSEGDSAFGVSICAGFPFRKVGANGIVALAPCAISAFSFNVRLNSNVVKSA